MDLQMRDKLELTQRCRQKIIELLEKGVNIPNPLTLDIGEEVSTENISGNGVRIYPGCRIYGKDTVIAAGARIGSEGSATIQDCQIGPGVDLKGGYFRESVFLAGSSMGLGAHVREGCILEEEASGAHCVGLKQTILFPFVTLGSLINFCDCLMSGGSSKKDHSEVGSSYIHFNFTPDGDKATPSLLGDVPRGVMLNQPAIFLGGQGGMVGPLRLGFGNASAAGAILRKDTLDERMIINAGAYPPMVRAFERYRYANVARILRNNIYYLASLVALEYWYRNVRRRFFSRMEYGDLLFQGAIDKLSLARKERTGRLISMVEKIPATHEACRCGTAEKRCELHNEIGNVCGIFLETPSGLDETQAGRRFLGSFENHFRQNGGEYIPTIQGMPATIVQEGTRWLEGLIDFLCGKAGALLPSFNLFDKQPILG